MCESKVILKSDGREEVVMEDVVLLNIEGEKLLFRNVTGEEKVIVDAVIDAIDFVNHTVYLKPK